MIDEVHGRRQLPLLSSLAESGNCLPTKCLSLPLSLPPSFTLSLRLSRSHYNFLPFLLASSLPLLTNQSFCYCLPDNRSSVIMRLCFISLLNEHYTHCKHSRQQLMVNGFSCFLAYCAEYLSELIKMFTYCRRRNLM